LALPGLVAFGFSATAAWRAWRDAQAAARGAEAVSEIMHASTRLMQERGALLEALGSGAPAPLARAAADSDEALTLARQALLKAGLSIDAVEQTQDSMVTARRRSFNDIERHVMLRSSVERINRLVETLDEEALRVERGITLASPSVGVAADLARAAHGLRGIAGQRNAILSMWLGGMDLEPDERDALLVLTGRLAGAWAQLQQGVRASNPNYVVTEATAFTGSRFFGQEEPWFRELVKTAAAGDERPMAYEPFRRWSQSVLTGLLPVREALMTQAIARGEVAVNTAQRQLILACGAVAASLGLIVTAMFALLRGLIGPVRRMTAAMTALAGNDLAAPVPHRSRLLEIGTMADAVAVFRDNLVRLHQRDADLARTNRRFDAALANMSQGLCMFGPDRRLAVANARFAELFGLSPAAVADGARYRDLLEDSLRHGVLSMADSESLRELLRRVRDGTSSLKSFFWELDDGRAIAVHDQPMNDGGWLSTFEDVTEKRQAEARIAHMAHHDALTGLPNRVLFRERLGEALARARRGEEFAVLCIDLDNFKAVNDTLGHPVGDALLCAVTERLQGLLRDADTVARLGGDEFAVLQSSANQPGNVTTLARRIIEGLSAPYEVAGHQVVVGASIGIAMAPRDADAADALIKNADLALYRAKSGGRGAWRFFEPEMDALMQSRRLLELDLRRALVAEEFEVHYQPLVDLRTRRPTGLEALVRWRHPQRGLVSPADFIPLAEEIGLIGPIGEWVLRRACAEAVGWPGAPKIAVNLSATQFRAGEALVAVVADALAATGLPANRLELEITETAMLEDVEQTLATLHKLRAHGVSISMDDFGTGYSSLSYLRVFPFDKVKIDQSFVRGIADGNGDCAAIVRAIAGLCGDLGMSTTAEGVETEDQLRHLIAKGCTEVQGYLFSRPVPASEVPRLLLQPLSQPSAVANAV
jgi:diguanylate cyclase (GGDEF)-like protein